MSPNTEYIELLVFKFNNGSISAEELEVLKEWYKSHDDQHVIITSGKDESSEEVKSRILGSLLAKVADAGRKPAKSMRLIRWIVATAAAVLVAIGAWVVLDREVQVRNFGVEKKASIQPGGNKATLTLADGRTIVLSTSQAGIVTGKEITYADGAPVGQTSIDESAYSNSLLTLQTPRGGTYKITLEDGTDVWLNAASTIRYPLHFASEARIVELDGEAYFSVKAAYQKNGDRIPFKVKGRRQEIEVVGTQFNIANYPEQASDRTTLVEGKVLVSDHQSRIIMHPNEQAVTTTGKTLVKKVDVNNFIAWREGKFGFDNKTFEETMNEVGRWYDLDIIYINGIPKEELTGDAFRNQNISFVLRLLEVAEIDYKLDAKRRKLI
ncbi:MAG: FecR family protein, partial [Pedobacter sp.]